MPQPPCWKKRLSTHCLFDHLQPSLCVCHQVDTVTLFLPGNSNSQPKPHQRSRHRSRMPALLSSRRLANPAPLGRLGVIPTQNRHGPMLKSYLPPESKPKHTPGTKPKARSLFSRQCRRTPENSSRSCRQAKSKRSPPARRFDLCRKQPVF